MDDVNSKDWCEKPRVAGTLGNGWCVRIDGTDVFDSVNQYGCKTRRSFDIVKGLGSKEEADAYLAQWLKDQLPDFGAQRLRADTAEAERGAARQALDATRDALESAQYSNAELASKLEERDQLFSDLVNSPHAVSVPLELWKRIKVFAGAALNPKPEAGSHAK